MEQITMISKTQVNTTMMQKDGIYISKKKQRQDKQEDEPRWLSIPTFSAEQADFGDHVVTMVIMRGASLSVRENTSWWSAKRGRRRSHDAASSVL
jgi:hypothetical protein